MRIFYVALVVGGASFFSPVIVLAQSPPVPTSSATPEAPKSPPEQANPPEQSATPAPPIVPRPEEKLPPTNPPAATTPPVPMTWPVRRPSMWGPLVDGRIREEPYWYGKDLGLVLGAMDVGTALLLASGQKDIQVFGFANFAVAHVFMGPIFHWAYGYTARGFGALSLNVVLPILGGYVGTGSGSSEGLIALTAIGFLGAQAIDVFALAQGTQRISHMDPPRSAWRPASLGILPWMDQQRTGLSIVGQF